MRCHQISGSLPAVASFGTIVSALGDANQGVVSVLLPAMADETLASVGMVHGPLVAVRDARMLGDGSSFVHLETELAEWIGPLRDNDEESWCAGLTYGHTTNWHLNDLRRRISQVCRISRRSILETFTAIAPRGRWRGAERLLVEPRVVEHLFQCRMCTAPAKQVCTHNGAPKRRVARSGKHNSAPRGR